MIDELLYYYSSTRCTCFDTWSFLFPEEVQIDRATKLHIVSLSQADVPDVVATAAAAGDSSTIFSYLSRHPEEVKVVPGYYRKARVL